MTSEKGAEAKSKTPEKKTTAKKTTAKKKTVKKKTAEKKVAEQKVSEEKVAKKAAKKKTASSAKRIRVRQVKSGIGSSRKIRGTLAALGLKHHQDEVELPDNVSVRGMVGKVRHLVSVTEES